MKIKASDAFMHGWVGRHLDARPNHVYEVPHVVGEVLIKANLAAEVPDDTPLGDPDAPAAAEPTPADDLLGEGKAAPELENKTEPEPTNKAAKK